MSSYQVYIGGISLILTAVAIAMVYSIFYIHYGWRQKKQRRWVKEQEEKARLMTSYHPMRQMGEAPKTYPFPTVFELEASQGTQYAALCQKYNTHNHTSDLGDCRYEVCLGKPAIPCSVSKDGFHCDVCSNIPEPINGTAPTNGQWLTYDSDDGYWKVATRKCLING